MENNYKNQSHFAAKNISQKLKKLSKSEAMLGEFTSSVFLSNQSYIIGYLNCIIHSLMNTIELYTMWLKISDTHQKLFI